MEKQRGYELRSKQKQANGSHGYALRSSKRIRVSEVPKRAKKIKAPVRRVTKRLRFLLPNDFRVDTAALAPPILEYTEEDRLLYQSQSVECAETALNFFNKSKEAIKLGNGGYELVEALGNSHSYCNGLWVHTNFTAKPINAQLDDDVPPIMFFAELKLLFPRPLRCIMCCILGPHDYGTNGCKICEKGYPNRHPEKGFRTGGYVPMDPIFK